MPFVTSPQLPVASKENARGYDGSASGARYLNTPRMIANQAGATVWRWDQQEPFGSTPPNDNPSGTGTFDFPLRFPGQYFDRETNLAYNYARDYDSALGRYIESDPVGLGGGTNTYLYARAKVQAPMGEVTTVVGRVMHNVPGKLLG